MNSANFIRPLLLTLLLLTMLPVQSVSADERPNNYRNNDRQGVSLDHAVKKARRQYNGRIISAETVRGDEGGTHNIRILTRDGRVKRVRVNSSTGEYVKQPRRR